jgi:hypothetical protein
MATPAWKTAAELADGYLTLNSNNLKKYLPHELDALQKELEKITRETRSLIIPQDNADASQGKNRKLLRLSQAVVVLQSYRSRMSR